VSDRTFVFLNHATPEDNAFATWLGAKLAAAGYDVWSDVLKLGGGETFWNDINDGIRRRTVLFLPILSTAAADSEKRGVHNEIAIATQVMRRGKLASFILPILLEYVAEPNPELIQLNYIDFSHGWATGLARLLDRMDKLESPRRSGPDRASMDRWLAVQGHLAGAVNDESSDHSSNWLRITNLPPVVRYVGTPAGRGVWDEFVKKSKPPMRAHMRLAATFAEPSEIQLEFSPDIPIKTEYEMPTQAFMDGKPPGGVPYLKGVDARRMVVDMLRQGWEAFALFRGLKKHEMSGRTSFYMPEGLLPGDWAHFVTKAGKHAKRKLVGIRGKRKIRYHFAVSAQPQILPFPRLIIYAHVVFSEGGVLVTQKNAAQRNRKALCKHWWNAEWRDRQTAMLTFLAKGTDSFDLPLGGVVATVSALPVQFEGPCSYVRYAMDDEADESLADLDARGGLPDDDDEEDRE
jgi:hypothetical protein